MVHQRTTNPAWKAAVTDLIIDIPGAPENPYVEVAATYDYAKANRCRCPVCGDLGWPWAGWFHCESVRCGLVAVVGDGRCFRPVVRIASVEVRP